MARRGSRVRIAPNIYRDASGISYVVAAGSGATRHTIEKRFPFDHPLEEIKIERDEARLRARKHVPPKPGEATLADDVAQYLRSPVARARTGELLESPETRASELQAWTDVLGHRRRSSLTDEDLEAVLLAWRDQGKAASTLNHRRNAAIQLWRALDGRKAPNPAALTPHFREPKGEPREVVGTGLDEILAAMPPSKTRAMYRLFAETGWPPERIRQIERHHVRWHVPSVFLVDRIKGQGMPGREFPLSARGLEAMRAFDRINAYGGVTRQTLLTVFRRALRVVNAKRQARGRPAIPETTVPYDARHTIGAQVYRRTGDIYATAEFLGVTVETALRYTRAAIPDRMRAAAAAIDDVRGKPLRKQTRKARTRP